MLHPAEHAVVMTSRKLGQSSLAVTPIGFGAFKIGRNEGIKYAASYDLPGERQVGELLRAVLSLGVNYFDTAPAYGASEERIGRFVAASGPLAMKTSSQGRSDLDQLSQSVQPNVLPIISTKVGETFESGRSTYDYSAEAINASLARSRKRLCADVLDLVFIHAHADDLAILRDTDAVKTLQVARDTGAVRAIGLSGKTPEAALAALDWADAIMVEYHLLDRSHDAVIAEAAARGVGVIVKKGLASGRLEVREAVEFVLGNPGVTNLVVGTLNAEHLEEIVAIARRIRR